MNILKNIDMINKKIWFISDSHFAHRNVLEFENRPFETIEEMESEMIEAWNSVVGKNDLVYMLGDFCFGGVAKWIEILDQLKGQITLIKGNHDKSKIIERVKRDGYLEEIHYVGEYIKIDNMQLHLTHYPLGMGERPFLMNISGHIHSKPSELINQVNVGVDSAFMENYQKEKGLPFGTPVDLEYIMEHLRKINEIISAKYVKGS